ncbi:MAG: hypothetical protein IT428_10680 [Planctomycetaceae bacterium]|nr:hypothetical protein [Planctomycetaceae bacterium]
MRWIMLCTAILLSGCQDAPERPTNASIDASEPDHPERQMVREWLRKNVEAGRWEEVEWSSALTMKEFYAVMIQEAQRKVDESERLMKEDSANSRTHEANRKQAEIELGVWRDLVPKVRCIRLKYRTENQVGNSETQVQIFSLGLGQALPTQKGAFDKYFPDPSQD